MTAMLIITDTSLDGMMEALPPNGDPLGTTGPHGITLPDGRTVIPKCWRPRLVCGPVEVVDWTSDSLRRRLNGLLGTDSEWMFYLTVGRDGHSIWDLMFVYRYLSCHDGTIGLYSELNQPLSPEVPVTRIDISSKGPGMKPLTWTPKSDVLYLFTDPSRTASSHDTAILDRTRRDEEGPHGCWIPSDGITLGELMGICGNAVANYTVYGASQDGIQVSGEPVEVVAREDKVLPAPAASAAPGAPEGKAVLRRQIGHIGRAAAPFRTAQVDVMVSHHGCPSPVLPSG